MGVGFGIERNLGQDDEIEETYWGTLCISNIFAVPGWDELKFSLYITANNQSQ